MSDLKVAETWRVVTTRGETREMVAAWVPRFGGRWTCENCGYHKTQRAAVMARCLADGIDVVEIVAPGESTRAEALVVERREREALANAMWETVVDIEKRAASAREVMVTADQSRAAVLSTKAGAYEHAAKLLRDDLVRLTKPGAR